jgi:hypothetical protein
MGTAGTESREGCSIVNIKIIIMCASRGMEDGGWLHRSCLMSQDLEQNVTSKWETELRLTNICWAELYAKRPLSSLSPWDRARRGVILQQPCFSSSIGSWDMKSRWGLLEMDQWNQYHKFLKENKTVVIWLEHSQQTLQVRQPLSRS